MPMEGMSAPDEEDGDRVSLTSFGLNSTVVTENLSRSVRGANFAGVNGNDESGESSSDDEMAINAYGSENPLRQRGQRKHAPLLESALLHPTVEVELSPAAIDAALKGETPFGSQQQRSKETSAAQRFEEERHMLSNFDPFVGQQKQDLEELELEEESINFLPSSPSKLEKTKDSPRQELNAFGQLFDGHHDMQPLNQPKHRSAEEHSGPSFASSFSPFPKHAYWSSRGCTRPEYGESTPLSSNTRRGRHSGRFGGLSILGQTVKSAVSCAVYAASSLIMGQHQSSNPFQNSSRSSPPMHRSRWRWGAKQLILAIAGLSFITMWVASSLVSETAGSDQLMNDQIRSSGSKGQVSTYAVRGGQLLDAGEIMSEGAQPSRKMEKARPHWWRKSTIVDQTGERSRLNQYTNNVMNVGLDRSPSSLEVDGAMPQGVVVRTADDGSILIKLPPPKMGQSRDKKNTLEKAAEVLETFSPLLGAVQSESVEAATKSIPGKHKKPKKKGPAKGQALDSSPMTSNLLDNEEGTLYIKIPYTPESEIEEFPQKQELEPPLRGASPRHKGLRHYSPPPLESRHKQEHRGLLNTLRDEFDSWSHKHKKNYHSQDERDRRFHIWTKNHMRISEKNEMHGPCKLTGKPVFGHNLFSDLDPDEFQSQFLTGYRGPRVHDHRKKSSTPHFTDASVSRGPPVHRHPTIQRKLEEYHPMYGSDTVTSDSASRLHGEKYRFSISANCSWWDVSCYLRWIFGYQYIGGTREPIFDNDSYPSSLDWRQMGVVSDVHSQGSCGACWAITAVQTIESAYAIKTGTLYDLNEEEVIACDGSCEMCNGGWPQNAYQYVMDNDGLPTKGSDYDADWLYTVTAVLGGESDEAGDDDLQSYFAQTCPAGKREGGEGDSHSHSNSGDNNYYDGVYAYQNSQRYGKIKGYGYATDRCVCYTDGSGCDCEDQNEKLAVLNIASYGPAAVCLEASLWQNYEGGIMTSDIGCSSGFLDMNHCVEVVGYAFTDGGDGEDGGGDNSKSGSNDSRSGSGDDQREGYWIVKNQWSSYWGMSGYAYVSMGDNTCGILNDMTQVYME